jgi:hypothetical protein
MLQCVRGDRRDDGQGFVHAMIASSHREYRGKSHAQITSAAPPRDHEVRVRDREYDPTRILECARKRIEFLDS